MCVHWNRTTSEWTYFMNHADIPSLPLVIPPCVVLSILVGTKEKKSLKRATNYCNPARTWRIRKIFVAINSWASELYYWGHTMITWKCVFFNMVLFNLKLHWQNSVYLLSGDTAVHQVWKHFSSAFFGFFTAEILRYLKCGVKHLRDKEWRTYVGARKKISILPTFRDIRVQS